MLPKRFCIPIKWFRIVEDHYGFDMVVPQRFTYDILGPQCGGIEVVWPHGKKLGPGDSTLTNGVMLAWCSLSYLPSLPHMFLPS
jgi:hypothetical protein